MLRIYSAERLGKSGVAMTGFLQNYFNNRLFSNWLSGFFEKIDGERKISPMFSFENGVSLYNKTRELFKEWNAPFIEKNN